MDLRRRITKSSQVQRFNKRKMERERKKLRTKKFGQMELKHARRGVSSCMLALCSGFFLLLTLSASYISRGDVGFIVGILGLMSLVMSIIGFRRGIEGFKERNKNYISCKVGVGCNGVLVAIYVSMFIRGLF